MLCLPMLLPPAIVLLLIYRRSGFDYDSLYVKGVRLCAINLCFVTPTCAVVSYMTPPKLITHPATKAVHILAHDESDFWGEPALMRTVHVPESYRLEAANGWTRSISRLEFVTAERWPKSERGELHETYFYDGDPRSRLLVDRFEKSDDVPAPVAILCTVSSTTLLVFLWRHSIFAPRKPKSVDDFA